MNESSFVPANDKTWSPHFADGVKAAIERLPPKVLRAARQVTLSDMRTALVELHRQLPEWTAEVDGKPWAVTLRKREQGDVTHEMGMYEYDRKVAVQGFAEEVVDTIGQWLADRCGPQVFSTELQPDDDILFVPRT
ncbi:MAG: hypothetical protein ABI867_29510 [Kofleriaceae bacterium]